MFAKIPTEHLPEIIDSDVPGRGHEETVEREALHLVGVLPLLGSNPRHPTLHRLLSEGNNVGPSLGGQAVRAGPGFTVPQKP